MWQAAILRNALCRKLRSFAVVLCPNTALCKQVKSVADSLTTQEGHCLASTEFAYDVIADVSCSPDIVVSTPAGLLSCLKDLDRSFVNEWLAGIASVVIDEADMLMTGGYHPKLKMLMEVKYDDNKSILTQSCDDTGFNNS